MASTPSDGPKLSSDRQLRRVGHLLNRTKTTAGKKKERKRNRIKMETRSRKVSELSIVGRNGKATRIGGRSVLRFVTHGHGLWLGPYHTNLEAEGWRKETAVSNY